ncbi:MAG: methylmalonyl-CoA mutase [Hyphomicrobium sp. 32-62-53]|nr:MAG: methylmalonyl-CoA mutase [Hyphomicrobium sp. 12-62-95]OYY00686.1 MAG: methylmalonyl-CoA mutase [Hyphomicrobium sp. 32-62-53]
MTAPTSSDAPVMPLATGFTEATRDAWLALVDKAIKGAEFEKKMVGKTADGLRIEPIYTPADALPHATGSVPGAAPLTRGTHATPNGLGWDIRQYHSGTDPKSINAAILEDLNGGTTSIALSIAGGNGLDLSTQALSAALDGVLLDICPVTLDAHENAPAAAKALIAVWEKQGLAPAQRRGGFGFDPLGTLAVFGALSKPLDDALAEAAAVMASAKDMPGVTALTVDGHAYHCAGATEAQELAATLATTVAYLRAADKAGIAPTDALPKIAINLAVDADQFLAIAKLRAARRLVWRVAEASGAGDAAKSVHFDAVTSWRMLAKRDPWTNIIRTAIACAGGALGGADSITVLPFTFPLGETDSFARRVARNIQIVCQEESYLGRVVDPAGGSWYVEKLTDDLAQKAWSLFQDIEKQGGMAAALQSGYVQAEIAKSAETKAKAIATGRAELTGVSAFPILGDDGIAPSPWPHNPPTKATPAVTITPLKMARLAEPFETLRDAADARAAKTGKPYAVFLASLGQVVEHNVRSTWIKNYLAAGGIAANMSDGYPNADAAAAAFKASGLDAACICSSDAVNAEHAEATAKALKASGAKLVLMAGRPGDREAALKAAGVDQFLSAGQDAVATLKGLQEKLG